MKCRIPLDFAKPGGECHELEQGFDLLASDEKGSLVRLAPETPPALKPDGARVVYAAWDRSQTFLRVIRAATEHDRLMRFSRPAHADDLAPLCCDAPPRYAGIYDDGSGRFFALNVDPSAARPHAVGRLFHYFICGSCSNTTAFVLD
jgi:hypothetical protein